MVREKIVSACQSSNLAWHAEFERAVDRLTALGLSDPLGSALFRAKYCNDRESGRRALHMLTHKAAKRLRIDMDCLSYVRGLATVALKEFMVDACEKCQGTGNVQEGAHIVQCSKCNGTGAKQHSDAERALTAGLPVESWSKHQKRFDGVMACLMGSVAATSGRVSELLREAA